MAIECGGYKLLKYEQVKEELISNPRRWLVTGVSGFIGSALLEELLELDQCVIGLDNFSSGKINNLEGVRHKISPEKWKNFTLHIGDIRNLSDCQKSCKNVDVVLHQAALGSVPRSIATPLETTENNIGGFLNIILSAKDADVNGFVYASSSSVYGDDSNLPKLEGRIGAPLSTYALTKSINEQFSEVFSKNYSFGSIGLRYFNVFGRRQDPYGSYAAVIPKWINLLMNSQEVVINGDGETSRDFCYVDNVVQANLISAINRDWDQKNAEFYNVAFGERTTLNQLLNLIHQSLLDNGLKDVEINSRHGQERQGDIRHSHASIAEIQRRLNYHPIIDVEEGIKRTVNWYINDRKFFYNEFNST
jgi:UDP-N-acetylglucosamine 4-epimerase